MESVECHKGDLAGEGHDRVLLVCFPFYFIFIFFIFLLCLVDRFLLVPSRSLVVRGDCRTRFGCRQQGVR